MDYENVAREIANTSILIDGFQGSDLNDVYVAKLRKSGITAFFTSVSDSHADLRQTMLNIRSTKAFIQEHSGDLVLCTNTGDIARAKATGSVGILLSFQDTYCLGYDIDLIECFYELGVRMVQLTANDSNIVGDGCGEQRGAGLTKFGKRLVRKLNELGILVDLSHVGDRTRADALDVSEKPCIVSHGNADGFCKNPRNISDGVIGRLAAKGGVIGATTYPSLCTWRENPTIEDFLDNIDYLVNLVGVDAVGLGLAQIEGLDLDAYLGQYPQLYGKAQWPAGLESITAWPRIIERLLERGYSRDDTTKIAGLNFFAVYKAIIG